MFSKHFFYGNERIRFSFSEVFWKRIYLVIAFPSNRHSSKWDRIIFYHQIVLHKLIRIIPNFEFILICLWREMDNSYYWVDAIYFADVDSPWIDQRDYVRAKKNKKQNRVDLQNEGVIQSQQHPLSPAPHGSLRTTTTALAFSSGMSGTRAWHWKWTK